MVKTRTERFLVVSSFYLVDNKIKSESALISMTMIKVSALDF